MGPSYQYLRDNPEMSANIGRMISEAGTGSNVSNLAMENSSYDPQHPEFGPGAMSPQYGGFLNMFLPGSNEYLTSKLNQVLKSDRSKETLARLGVDPAGGAPEVLSKQVETEVAKWVKVATEKNIKIEP
jgi:hypothetical protein